MAAERSQGENGSGADSVANAPRMLAELAGGRMFQGLDRDAMNRLVAIARRLEFEPGQMIFSQGDPASAFFLLVRGQVKVFKLLRDGRTATLRYVRPGDIFAESALTAERYPAYTETTAPCVLYRFPVADFRELLLARPQLALEMLGRTTQLMSLLNRRIEELLLPVPARLARYLLVLADAQLEPPAVRPATAGAPVSARVVRLPTSKRELAARLGTVPETLSRTFDRLKRGAVIQMSGDHELIEILSFEKLHRLAQD
jgi:CRP/FNR family transcriptional regulator